MNLSKTDRELISNLKGRVSKVLSISSQLDAAEKESLDNLYSVLDEIILWDKKFTKRKATSFKKHLNQVGALLEYSQKKYIREHIVPLLSSIINREWRPADE